MKEGNHIKYFNEDKNLNKLDIIVLAETKLKDTDRNIEKDLSNWEIIGRYDVGDARKHMGLLLLKSKESKLIGQVTISYKTAKRNEDTQIEGLIVKLENGINIGFLYCRSTPTIKEIEGITKNFEECNLLIGDLNLSHRIESDKEKLIRLCNNTKMNILHEITRSVSNNQLDYILTNLDLAETCYATSFNNFISDHKTITVRVGLNQNEFTKEFKMKITFDKESHLKSNKIESCSSGDSYISDKLLSDSYMSYSEGSSIDTQEENGDIFNIASNTLDVSSHVSQLEGIHRLFSRRFKNIDQSTCWLNSCLQLILNAFDYAEFEHNSFISELGREILRLQLSDDIQALDPS